LAETTPPGWVRGRVVAVDQAGVVAVDRAGVVAVDRAGVVAVDQAGLRMSALDVGRPRARRLRGRRLASV
jgi:hypothetical protein